jgi:hypothetical protein
MYKKSVKINMKTDKDIEILKKFGPVSKLQLAEKLNISLRDADNLIRRIMKKNRHLIYIYSWEKKGNSYAAIYSISETGKNKDAPQPQPVIDEELKKKKQMENAKILNKILKQENRWFRTLGIPA